jgi:cobalt-precorrin-5B (C1)-methyltransferase
MGDFVGGTLKYLRGHPVSRLTIAGGFAKLAKLAAGHLDLHAARTRVDTAARGAILAALGADDATVDRARAAAGAGELLALADGRKGALSHLIAARARELAFTTLSGNTAVEVAIVDRQDRFLARAGT